MKLFQFKRIKLGMCHVSIYINWDKNIIMLGDVQFLFLFLSSYSCFFKHLLSLRCWFHISQVEEFVLVITMVLWKVQFCLFYKELYPNGLKLVKEDGWNWSIKKYFIMLEVHGWLTKASITLTHCKFQFNSST